MSGIKLDVKSAIGDFNSYEKKVQDAMKVTLTKSAVKMSRLQFSILRQRVKDWHGELGGSISPKKTGTYSYEIGPDISRVNYAGYVEYGTRFFAGYHYVKRAFNIVAPKFIRALKNNIENAR